MSTRIAVIYYSMTGTVQTLAEAIAEGAEETGAEVRLRHVEETAPEEAIQSREAWAAHREEVADEPMASVDDLEWADGFALGTPTRFGTPSAQLKQFIDQTGPLWQEGKLADKAATSFTSAMNSNGGNESTLVGLNNVFYHWGSIIVPSGYVDERLFHSGGNPYGTSWATGQDGAAPDDATLTSARIQGQRLARFAALLTEGALVAA